MKKNYKYKIEWLWRKTRLSLTSSALLDARSYAKAVRKQDEVTELKIIRSDGRMMDSWIWRRSSMGPYMWHKEEI